MNSDKPRKDLAIRDCLAAYWRRNVQILSVLLIAWAVLGLGCGILFADYLNQWQIGGYPLGFWFAQQGAIIGFVVIILIYCLMMNRLDSSHLSELEQLDPDRVRKVREADGAAGGTK